MRKILVSSIIAAGLAGCAGTPPPQSSAQLTVIPDSQGLPAPTRSDLAASDRPALIGPLDTINVDIFNVPELSREMQVDARGRISMPQTDSAACRGEKVYVRVEPGVPSIVKKQ